MRTEEQKGGGKRIKEEVVTYSFYKNSFKQPFSFNVALNWLECIRFLTYAGIYFIPVPSFPLFKHT